MAQKDRSASSLTGRILNGSGAVVAELGDPDDLSMRRFIATCWYPTTDATDEITVEAADADHARALVQHALEADEAPRARIELREDHAAHTRRKARGEAGDIAEELAQMTALAEPVDWARVEALALRLAELARGAAS